MEKIVIRGHRPLFGTVAASGSKNAALPILAASLLAEGTTTLCNVPHLTDITLMCEILAELGCHVTQHEHTVTVCADALRRYEISYNLTGQMRGSFLVMGPLLARFGRVRIAMPGGCAIGARPIDLHIKGLVALGAQIRNRQGFIDATASKLTGTKIYLDFPSVGATENILCAATLAEGLTVIENPATEPEIVDLANFLCRLGAKISGAGTDTIKIYGVTALRGAQHAIISDRIEAGTLLVAAAATGGQVTVTDIVPDYMKPLTAKLSEMQVPVSVADKAVTVSGVGLLRATDIKTLPFPGFPTDMQAQMTSLLALSSGTGIITETVFENRFMHTGELNRMGASIKVAGRSAVIEGKKSLTGTRVKATDLRAGAALVIAGLAARGDTEISDIHHIERGYDHLDEKLRSLGADICRI